MFDTGGPYDADHLFDAVRAWRPSERLAAAVFSHHHIDHCLGTGRVEAEAADTGRDSPVMYGHVAMAANFRRYEKTLGWNTAINSRQFGRPIAEDGRSPRSTGTATSSTRTR